MAAVDFLAAVPVVVFLWAVAAVPDLGLAAVEGVCATAVTPSANVARRTETDLLMVCSHSKRQFCDEEERRRFRHGWRDANTSQTPPTTIRRVKTHTTILMIARTFFKPRPLARERESNTIAEIWAVRKHTKPKVAKASPSPPATAATPVAFVEEIPRNAEANGSTKNKKGTQPRKMPQRKRSLFVSVIGSTAGRVPQVVRPGNTHRRQVPK